MPASQALEQLLTPVTERDHQDGPADARWTIVVYGDYECPSTRRVDRAVRHLQSCCTDGLRYVYRHFPLRELHPHAQHAAEAAEAAAAQGKFWAMHETLFGHQLALGDVQLVAHAVEVGLDRQRFLDEMRRHLYRDRVHRDVEAARMNGARGTPTIFVNGWLYHGERDAPSLESALSARPRASGEGEHELPAFLPAVEERRRTF
ncbi:MAG TPA: thioredoxin domain-containing protein [Gemmatimonadaceae bacterium]|nr:thioredoxin domain-containing protein [Gemmatimonadaceae bacterium]